MYQTVIVDDEPLIVDGIVKAIDWIGFHIEIASAESSAESALRYLSEHPADILITDVSMPGMSGLELIRHAKKVNPNLYVIVLSAYDKFEYVSQALRCGAENYLLKPLDPDELSDSISQILGHLQEREQLSGTYGRSMMTFRSAFTEQWLKNLLTGSDLASKAELLGIDLNAASFTVVIFSVTAASTGNGAAVLSRFFDLLLRHLIGRFTGNFFFETPLRLVCVLSPSFTETTSVPVFLTQVLQAAHLRGLSVFASIGSTVLHCSKVSQSYHQADEFSFLEYSPLPYVLFRERQGLLEAASQVLNAYNSRESNDSDDDGIQALYQGYDAELVSYSLLSVQTALLCPKEYELREHYPQLAELLFTLPMDSGAAGQQKQVVLQYLAMVRTILLRKQQNTSPMVDAVIHSIEEFSDKDISLKTLAIRLNVTPSYLGSMFHQQTGYYFNDYLNDARLKYAAELLEHTDHKIKDIVEQIGFSSQTYFNRSFKRYFDTSPVNYRREHKLKEL